MLRERFKKQVRRKRSDEVFSKIETRWEEMEVTQCVRNAGPTNKLGHK